jgi:hypothetical protein
MTLAMGGVRPEETGLASGLVNTTLQVGGAIGLAVLATLATNRASTLAAGGDSSAAALTGGYQLAFIVAAGLLVVAIAIAALVLRPGAAQEVPAGAEVVFSSEAA